MPQAATFKVPRLYKAAAKLASVVKEENGNLEDLVQQYNKKTNVKALGALVTKTLNNEALVDTIIQNSKFVTEGPDASPWLYKVLITELLLGKQRLPVGSKPIQAILAHGPSLRTELLRAQGKLHDKRKKSKSETEDAENSEQEHVTSEGENAAAAESEETSKMKPKKRKREKELTQVEESDVMDSISKPKKRKKRNKTNPSSEESVTNDQQFVKNKKKKKHNPISHKVSPKKFKTKKGKKRHNSS